MKRGMLLLTVCLLLGGCSTALINRLAGIEDQAIDGAKMVMCRGASIGAWNREFGQDPVKAAAWRDLCSDTLREMPLASSPR